VNRKTVFLVLIAIGIGFSWGTLSITHNVFPKPQLRTVIALISQQPAQEKHNNDWLERVNIHKKAAHKARIALVGDSITQQANWTDILDRNDVDNRGIGGDTSTLILKRLDAIYKDHYSVYFLMFGINDFLRGAEVDYVLNNYQSIATHLAQKNAKVVIQSTLFCNPSKAPFGCSEVNQKVHQLNQQLQKLELPNIQFLDLNSIFADDTVLRTEMTSDGIHLNLIGYQTWATVLTEYLSDQFD
jgi:lysophospholipase L1-like esterase